MWWTLSRRDRAWVAIVRARVRDARARLDLHVNVTGDLMMVRATAHRRNAARSLAESRVHFEPATIGPDIVVATGPAESRRKKPRG
jgi:hypothetical protein